MKLIKIPKAPVASTWSGRVECTFVSLNKRQRKYLNNFVGRNKDVMKMKTVLHVENNRLGIVRLLHLINQIGEDKLLDAHPLDHKLVYEYPEAYFKLGRQRKIGWKQKKALFKESGV
jgi:hypothetical protein